MIPILVHDPEYWHQELKPLLREIDLALQDAVPKAHKVFTGHLKKPVNRPLLSNLIRYFMLEYLKGAGLEARDIDDNDDESWELRNLSNNGIEILYRGSRIRIRKGLEAPCSSTKASRDFYQQVLGPEFANWEVITNILILWNLNNELLYQNEMYLMRPLGSTRNKVRLEWRKAVMLNSVAITEKVEPVYAMPSDLPIGLEQEEQDRPDKTGTDDAD